KHGVRLLPEVRPTAGALLGGWVLDVLAVTAVGSVETGAVQAWPRDVRLGGGAARVRRVEPLGEELAEQAPARLALVAQPARERGLELRFGDRAAAVCLLDRLQDVGERVGAEDLPQRDVGRGGPLVRRAAGEQPGRRRVRRRRRPEASGPRVVG